MTKSVTAGTTATVQVVFDYNPSTKFRLSANLRSQVEEPLATRLSAIPGDSIKTRVLDVCADRIPAGGLMSAGMLMDRLAFMISSLRGDDIDSRVKPDGLYETVLAISECWWSASDKGTRSFSMVFEFDTVLVTQAEAVKYLSDQASGITDAVMTGEL
jgi:hypothetical protein